MFPSVDLSSPPRFAPSRAPHDGAAVALFESRFGALRRTGGLVSLTDLALAFSHLPYENLTKILAWDGGRGGPALRPPRTVMEDHLRLGTGGTCFSLTELLRQLATAAGFSCHPVMAHMRHGANIHCALRVEADGRPYLVDPGYLVRRPLPLDAPGAARVGAAGEVMLVPAGSVAGVPPGVPPGDLDLFTVEDEGPRWRYRLSDRAPGEAEFLGHWRRSFEGVAMRSLLISRRSDEGELLYLHNHKLRRQAAGERSNSNLRVGLEGAVEQLFGIDPEVTRRAAALLREQRAAWLAREQRAAWLAREGR